MGVELHCGDCLEVMPTLAANSVDSIVTDPPLNVMLPNDREVVSLRLSKCRFLCIISDIANLNWGKNLVGIETRIGVPKSAMNFNERVAIRQIEVIGESTQPILPFEANALLSVLGGNSAFKFIEGFSSSAIRNLLSRKFRMACSGFWIGELPNVGFS